MKTKFVCELVIELDIAGTLETQVLAPTKKHVRGWIETAFADAVMKPIVVTSKHGIVHNVRVSKTRVRSVDKD